MYGTRSDSSVNNSSQLQPGWRSRKQKEFPVCTSSVDLAIMASFGGILLGGTTVEYQGNRFEPFCAQEMSVVCVFGKKSNAMGGWLRSCPQSCLWCSLTEPEGRTWPEQRKPSMWPYDTAQQSEGQKQLIQSNICLCSNEKAVQLLQDSGFYPEGGGNAEGYVVQREGGKTSNYKMLVVWNCV